MIVQLVLKGLLFYFVFLFVRSFIRGMKEGESIQQTRHGGKFEDHHQGGENRTQKKASKNDDDVVEADFRRL